MRRVLARESRLLSGFSFSACHDRRFVVFYLCHFRDKIKIPIRYPMKTSFCLKASLCLFSVFPAVAAITPVVEFRLGEAGSLDANNGPVDSALSGTPSGAQSIVNAITGTSGVAVGEAGVLAPGSTKYLDTSNATNSGWYASGPIGLANDNFAFGVFARADSLAGANQGDVFTLGGDGGSFKLSLAVNGWAASAHNIAWIGPDGGASGSFSPRTWVHLALVRQSGVTTFYINGVANGSYGGAPTHSSMHFCVSPGGGQYFDGMADEARVVTFDSTDSTVDILNALTNGPVQVPNRLVSTATTAYDQVALAAGTTSEFRPGVDSTKINKVDSFSVASGHTLKIVSDLGLSIGEYALFEYQSSTPIDLTNFTLQLPSRMGATLVQDSTNAPVHIVRVDIAGIGTVNWNGNVSTVWDSGTAPDVGGVQNWSSNGNATNFAAADSVVFNELATSFAVSINGADVSPSAVLLDPLGVDYTFSGSHGISGTCVVLKSSSGKVTFANTNSYTGGTTIAQGTLALGDGGTTGSVGTGAIINNGTLLIDRSDDISMGNSITGMGNLVHDGAGTTTFPSALGSTGAVTVNEGSVVFLNNIASNAFTIASAAQMEINVPLAAIRNMPTSVISGAGQLIKSGPGTLVWAASAATFAMDSGALIDVQEGSLIAGSNANENWTNNKADLHVAAGALFDASEATIVENGGIFVDAITGEGVIRVGYGAPGSYASKITFGVDNGSGTFAGVLANDEAVGSFTKAGNGTQVLSGMNTYTGDTTVDGGTLSISQAYLADGADVRLAAGATLDMTHSAVDSIDQLIIDGIAQPAGIYGSLTSAALTKVSYLTGSGMLRVGMFGYPSWAQTNASSQNAAADADGDGVANGVEYFMGLTGSGMTVNPAVVDGSVTWPRDAAALASFVVQISEDLTTWTAAPAADVDDSDPAEVIYTLPEGEVKHFVRLLVTPL